MGLLNVGVGQFAVDAVDEGAAALAFAGLDGGHAAIGEDEAGHALRGEVVDEVLLPSVVGVAFGRVAELLNSSTFTLWAPFSN